jgi:hypothetical protein
MRYENYQDGAYTIQNQCLGRDSNLALSEHVRVNQIGFTITEYVERMRIQHVVIRRLRVTVAENCLRRK